MAVSPLFARLHPPGSGGVAGADGAAGPAGAAGVSIYEYLHVGAADRYYLAGQQNTTGTSSANMVVGTLVAVPLFIGRAATIDRAKFRVGAVAGANAVARMGLYNNTSKSVIYPSSLIYDFGETPVATTFTDKVFTPSPEIVVAPGLYWAAFNMGVAVSSLVTIGVTANMFPLFGLTAWETVTIMNHLRVTLAYGALPATFTAGAVPSAIAPPALGFRFSA